MTSDLKLVPDFDIPWVVRIEGDPVQKNRARHHVVKNKDDTVNFVQTYSDQKDIEKFYKIQIWNQFKQLPFEGHVSIRVKFGVKRPASHYGTGKNAGIVKPLFKNAIPSKKDLDNMIKFLLDCCNGITWKDDHQVVKIMAEKVYTEKPFTRMHFIDKDQWIIF
jgi:Holliday junction resolvase RusA-like endonuclease